MNKKTKKNLSLMVILTQLGSNVLTFVLSLAVLKVTKRALDFSLIIVISSVVSVLSSVTIGKLVDKYAKKKVMAMAQGVSSLGLVIFMLYHQLTGQMTVWAVIVLTVVLNLSDSIFSTALMASANQIVDKPEDLNEFNGLVQMINGLSSLVAPLIAGALFNIFTVTQFVWLEIALEMVSLVFIRKLDYKQVKTKVETHDMEKVDLSMKATFEYLKQEKSLVFFSVGMFVMNLIIGAITIGFPVMMNRYFTGHQFIIGLISFVFSFGMILASIVYPNVKYKGPFYKPTLIGWLVFALGLVLVGLNLVFFTSQLYILAIILVFSTLLMSVAVSASRIPLISHFQAKIPAQQQGRIFSLLDTMIEVAVPISALLYGLLFDHVEGQFVYILSGLVLFTYVIFLIGFVKSRRELVMS